MPELPEVETVARDLRGLVIGATITGVRSTWARTFRSGDPEDFRGAVAGRTIVGTARRAKLVVLDLDDGRAITIHLKMTGQLFVVSSSIPEDPYVRAVLSFDDGRELRFRDIRKFGRIGVSSRNSLSGELEGELGGQRPFRGFGPEPLDPAFSRRAFRERLRGRRARLKALLIDQAFVAGVGNIYADEALWEARLHPLRTAATLRPADTTRLYRALRRLLAEAIDRRGSSVDDYTAPEGDGSMQEQLRVYQRAGEPCPRCGHPLRRIVVGGRATHFCSWCQRLPAADRAGAATILRGMMPPPGGGRGGRAQGPGDTLEPGRARRRGPRWTELAGPPAIGLTPDEAALASLRERVARTRAAAASRRARARAMAAGGDPDAGNSQGPAGPGAHDRGAGAP